MRKAVSQTSTTHQIEDTAKVSVDAFIWKGVLIHNAFVGLKCLLGEQFLQSKGTELQSGFLVL